MHQSAGILLFCSLFAGIAALAQAQTPGDSDLTPGGFSVRIDGRVRAYAGYLDGSEFDDQGDDGGKHSAIGAYESFRFYPGFDGVSGGGLQYGATVEFRQQDLQSPGGPNNNLALLSSQDDTGIDVHRVFGYLVLPAWGTLRFGTQYGIAAQFSAGTMENFNDGGWNGDVPRMLARNTQIPWPFADSDTMALAPKLVYLSPSLDTDDWGRFDAGLAFEPASVRPSVTDGNCPAAAQLGSNTGSQSGCDPLAGSVIGAQYARGRDTVELAARWRVVFGAVGVVAEAAYITGGTGSVDGPQLLTASSHPISYNGLNLADFGAALTYAGVQIGAHAQTGDFNNSLAGGEGSALALAPKGGKPATAFVTGVSYKLGPAVVGASYLSVDSQGAFGSQLTSAGGVPPIIIGLGQRHEDGVAAGATYKLRPSIALFLSYLYGERKQAGYDFVTGAAGATANNATHTQAVTLGASYSW